MMNKVDKRKKPSILITGGAGFLGQRIVDELLSESSPLSPGNIRILDKKKYRGEHEKKVEMLTGDVRDPEILSRACRDIDLVIHSAAIIDWGTKSKEEVLDINVGGTQNVIKACRENGVKFLVYTSSLDAVFTGKPLVNINENQPYPEKHHTVYCESKKLAEMAVHEAAGEGFNTVILRPSDIYGEADPYHIDSLIEMAQSGFYVRLGNGKSKCQHVYVGNMAWAHVLAAKALWEKNDKVTGQTYFITDGEGSNFFRFFDQVVAEAGYRIFPKNLWLPRGLALFIGSVSEGMAKFISLFKKYNPKFSRFAVIYTCTDFTFSAGKAAHDFGFAPKYSLTEALENTISYYRNQKNRP